MTISFDPTRKLESTVKPGVSFTVRVLNKFERARRDLALLPAREKLGNLAMRRRALMEDVPGENGQQLERPRSGCEVEAQCLDEEFGCIMLIDVQPAYIRSGLISIDGYEIAGQPADVESLIAQGDDALIEEIHAACLANGGLTPEQEKNSQSPGTSPAPAQDQATPTTVSIAAA